jgi:hypothetical protein
MRTDMSGAAWCEVHVIPAARIADPWQYSGE